MTRATPIQTNFTAGELSPRLRGRVDLAKYFNGVETLENMVIHPHGGVSRRSGTRFVAGVKDQARKVRLIPFEFSIEQAYILEFGHTYIRFYKDEGVIESTPGTPYEISSPYAEGDLFQIQFAQSADVMWLVHPNHKPRKLSRTGHTAWTIANYAPTSDPFTSANNYPACVAFYEERLVFGGTNAKPQTIFATKAGNFEDMTLGVTDDAGFQYTIATDQVNVIRWLSPGDVLAIGTTGGEFTMRSTARDEPVTPTNVQIKRQTTYGSAYLMARPLADTVLFVQRAGRKLREFAYAFETDGFRANDITILAEHVTASGIIDMAYQAEPDSVLWCVRQDGQVAAMTYERPENVIGWHRHILGGHAGSGHAVVESVAAIPAPGGHHSQLWLAVRRTIDGATKRYVEFLEESFDQHAAQDDAFFVDCGLSYDGAPATAISGLDHLEGETVAVLADGAAHPDRIVSGGAIVLARSAAKVHVGLPFASKLRTLRPEAGAQDGTAQAKIKRIHKIAVRFFNTLGAKIGPDDARLDLVTFRRGNEPMDAPPSLYSGDKELLFPAGFDSDAQILIVQDQPLPMTVLAVIPRLVTFEG